MLANHGGALSTGSVGLQLDVMAGRTLGIYPVRTVKGDPSPTHSPGVRFRIVLHLKTNFTKDVRENHPKFYPASTVTVKVAHNRSRGYIYI